MPTLSDTTAGLLQLGALILALALAYRPLGDYLAATGNPLAIAMRLRRDGKALELTREGLAAAIPLPSAKVDVRATAPGMLATQ